LYEIPNSGNHISEFILHGWGAELVRPALFTDLRLRDALMSWSSMVRVFSLLLLIGVFSCVFAGARAENIIEPQGSAALAAEDEDAPSALEMDLEAQGFRLGAPAFIRVFKADSSLEVWLLKGSRFELYRSYSICKWSGVLGPKLAEGDRQSPEGVYFITGGDLVVNARWHRAMNVGFPNPRDRALGLTGSGILIHGKCSSIGCFALTDKNVEEVYDVVEAALDAGQPRVPVHIYPFELTRERLAQEADSEWSDFWKELKRGHDLFLRDRLPPRTFVCNGQYAFQSRRARLVSLAGNQACTVLTRPARPVLAAVALKARFVRAAMTPRPPRLPVILHQSVEERAANCGPRDRHCLLIKAALKSSVPCPRKYGRCRNPQIAAVKSIDCPLKYPRCRKKGGVSRPAVATLKTKRTAR
jgi:murein L,D-transpeptidase YafK